MPSTLTRLLRKIKSGRVGEAHAEIDVQQSSANSGQSPQQIQGGNVSRARAGYSSSQKSHFGLDLVHEAVAPGLEGSKSFALDIVFVHGLNGDARKTWTHQNGTFWPQDLLPDRLPGSRIFTYGYDSKIFFSSSEADYRDFALGLVRELQYVQYNYGKAQPILFVCHSLGGIVVKEAINVASERQWSREVLDRCKGIVFLGTPHRGSQTAGPGALIANVLNVVWTPASFIVPGPRSKLISELERSSNMLFAISDRFVDKAKALEIASFYEVNKTPPTGQIIVDKNSGVLGLDHERRWPLFLNHLEITRFPDSESRELHAILSVLLEMATRIVPSPDSQSEYSLTHSEQDCVEQLNAVDIVEFEAQIEPRLPNTLIWLSSDPHYISWLTATSMGVLLVTGYAGCGKTVMSSYLSTKIPEEYMPASVICRFYCDAKVQEMSNLLDLMKSIVYQAVLCSQEALRLVVKAAKHDPGLWKSFERLWSLFELIVMSISTKRIVVIIDGLDELERSMQRRLASHILHLTGMNAGTATKFLVTSQPHASAVSELTPYSIRLALESMQDALAHDVTIFIQYKIRKLQEEKGWSDKTCLRLASAIESKADRSFLWASFSVAFLEQRIILDTTDLEETLSQVPPDLTRLYDSLLQQIVARDAPGPTLRVLNMILSSGRSFEIGELAVLLAIDKSHGSIADVQRDHAVRGVASIQHVLGPLVKTYKSRIQLVHSSLKDHLAEYGEPIGISERIGHELLAEKCIRYLLLHRSYRTSLDTASFTDYVTSPALSSSTTSSSTKNGTFKGSESDEQGSMLQALFTGIDGPDNSSTDSTTHEPFDYAVRFWAFHFQRCHALERSVVFALAVELYSNLEASQFEDLRGKANHVFGEFPATQDPLSISCFYGHERITQYFLAQGNSHTKLVTSAFYWAAVRGNLACLKLLHGQVESEHPMEFEGSHPLTEAAADGYVEVVEYLLRQKICSVNQPDANGRSALSRAAERSQEEVVSFLLSFEPLTDLNINSKDFKGRTALIWACSGNSPAIVKQLLRDPRTDLEVVDCESSGAFAWACRDGLADIVRILMNAGVRRGERNHADMTPLIQAVRSGDLKTVKTLFERRPHRQRTASSEEFSDLNIGALDKNGRNAVSWAAQVGDSRILKMLLSLAPGEALVPDHNGWLPLAWAMDPPGFPQHCGLLLPHSHERIDERDYDGNSLLSIAIGWNSWHIARILIQQSQIDVDSKNHYGRTALSLAASRGAIDIVMMLVEHRNANKFITDNAGKSALDHAIGEGHEEIVEYLQHS